MVIIKLLYLKLKLKLKNFRINEFKMHKEEFREKVRATYEENKSYRETARLLKLTHSTVAYIVKNSYERDKKKRGPYRLIDANVRNKIRQEINLLKLCNEKITAEKIKESCQIGSSLRTVQRAVSEILNENIVKIKINFKPLSKKDNIKTEKL